MEKKISFIIVTYNAMKWLAKCLDSVQNSSISCHTIVIDNGSTDGTVDFIKEKYPQVDVILTENNLGFGRGNNLGIEKAIAKGADYFFLLNQDAYIDEDTVHHLLTVAEKEQDYGIFSPIHFAGNKKSLDFGFQNYIRRNKISTSLFLDLFTNKLKPIYQVDFMNAAAWFIPKTTIEKVGGFNPLFFHYGEDRNYIDRLHFHGLKVGIVPNANIIHDRMQERKTMQRKGEKWSLLLEYFLNPNNNISAKDREKIILKDLLASLLKFNLNDAKFFFNKLKYLVKNRHEIDENIKLEKNEPYAFLNSKK